MKLNDKIRIKFFIVSLFLFSIHIVFTIPTLVNEDGFSERIFSINDLKMLTSLKGWYLFLL